jgi:hypothetical protein
VIPVPSQSRLVNSYTGSVVAAMFAGPEELHPVKRKESSTIIMNKRFM